MSFMSLVVWDDSMAMRAVEVMYGSMEGLVHFVLVVHPELAFADFETISARTTLPVDLVIYLWRTSDVFARMLDSGMARGVWDLEARQSAMGNLRGRVEDPEQKLADVVRGMEYLDRKSGVAVERGGEHGTGAVNVAVHFTQEGATDGGYRPLSTPPLRGALPADAEHAVDAAFRFAEGRPEDESAEVVVVEDEVE